MKKIIILCMILLNTARLSAQVQYEPKVFVAGNDTLPYQILYPEKFDSKKKYPLVFVLHGSGERGTDNKAQLIHGGKLFLRPEIREKFPAIVIFPQCPKNDFWANVKVTPTADGKRAFTFPYEKSPTKAMALLIGLVESYRKESTTDKRRIYIGGLSMGGMGTFELLARKPETFAAAFPICGGGNVDYVKKYKKVPLWIFHGAKDDIVLPIYSEMIVNKLKVLGRDVKFTLYPDANHNSWDRAFAEADFLPWLFSNSRKQLFFR